MDSIEQQSIKLTNELHDKSMQFADLAFFAEREGKKTEAKIHYQKAFELECQAAMLLMNRFEVEPSRSVLFRSAACLALKNDNFRDAERMAAFGLSGNPPLEIATELRAVFKEIVVHF